MSISSTVVCPASFACASATCGQMQMSPRVPAAVGCSALPGRSSSIGKLMTSVGPGRSSQRMWSSSIGFGSMKRMLSSASVATCIAVSTWSARAANSAPSIS